MGIWRNLDRRIFGWVEPVPLPGKICSTPGLRPGIRPRQKCLGRIPGLGHGVEQFSAVSKTCSTHAKTPGSNGNLPWLNMAQPPGRVSRGPTRNYCAHGDSSRPVRIPMGIPHVSSSSPMGRRQGNPLGIPIGPWLITARSPNHSMGKYGESP